MTENSEKKSNETIIKLCEKEHSFLRHELGHLKDCQIKFLTFSVMTTGLMLGLLGRFRILFSTENINFPSGTIWLLPLVVLLPSWWIFFDKATTITRIVGYFRIIEKIILGQKVAHNFFGWESALGEFRRQQNKEEIKSLVKKRTQKGPIKQLLKILVFQTPHCYWAITNYTFLGLSVLCWAASLNGTSTILIILAGIIILFSTIWNIYILWSLIDGKYSYDLNEKKWEIILQIKDSEEN